MKKNNRLLVRTAAAVIGAVIGLAGCGGSNTTNPTVGGTVTGLTADGLRLTDGIHILVLSANTSTFNFPAQFSPGTAYGVRVQTQPAGLTCTVANANGVVGTSSISNITVTCVPNHTLGGTIVSLTSSGLVLANGSDTVSPAASGTSFAFPTKVGEGSPYGVTVLTQPAGQTCTVNNGTGRMPTADVTGVQVNCI
jgi:hypothetical protein